MSDVNNLLPKEPGMKTSNWWLVFFFILGGIGVIAAQNLLFVKATAQQPSVATPAPPTRVQFRVVQLPDGTYVQKPELASDGEAAYSSRGAYPNPETAKLMQEEMAAAQETQKLAAGYRAAESDGDKEKFKTALRETLTAIFDLQQKRRAHEIEQIQTRLKKLEETMSKRDSAKKEIVDRRLEVLTGGIDELGWEDTLRTGPNAATIQRVPGFTPYGPGAQPPLTAPPVKLPAPANVPALPDVIPAPALPATPAVEPPAGATPATTVPLGIPAFRVPSAAPPATPATPPGNVPSPIVPRTTTGLK
jgi:hypothetical protein